MTRVTSKSGMTLIEVMLAITILVIGVFSMVQASSNCLAVAKRSQQFSEARQTMDRGMLEHPIIETNMVEDIAVDTVTYESGYTFSRTVEETEEDEDLFVIVTRVDWANKGGRKALELHGYLYSTNHPGSDE